MSNSALVGVEVKIPAFGVEQLLMFSLLHNPAILNHQNLIGFLNRAQPVGYHKGGSAFHQGLKTFLDEGLAFGIQV